MILTQILLLLAINSHYAIPVPIPVVYDYDYENWRHSHSNSNGQGQSWRQGPPPPYFPPRRYRETDSNTVSSPHPPMSHMRIEMSGPESPEITTQEILKYRDVEENTMPPPVPMVNSEMPMMPRNNWMPTPMPNSRDEEEMQVMKPPPNSNINLNPIMQMKMPKYEMGMQEFGMRMPMTEDMRPKNNIPEFQRLPTPETTTQTATPPTTEMEEMTDATERSGRPQSDATLKKKLEKMRLEMLRDGDNPKKKSKPSTRKSGTMKPQVQKQKSKSKATKKIVTPTPDTDEEETSESQEDDIVPVLKALGLPEDFASGTTTPKPKRSKSRQKQRKTTTTAASTTESDSEESPEERDEESDEEEETMTTTRKPSSTSRKPTTPKASSSRKPKPSASRVKAQSQRDESEEPAKDPQVQYAEGSGLGYTHNDPPYGPENPGPGDVHIKDAKWKGLRTGSVSGQVVRMMLGIPGKSVSVLKPVIVGAMDSGGQAGEALGIILENAARELPVVYSQAGEKWDSMMKKAGDIKGGALHIASGLVNTSAGIKNSLSGTLPLLFDGVGDMLGGLDGQVGQLIDFVTGLNDMASEGIIKAGRGAGNLVSGFIEGKKVQGQGALTGFKYGLNNEPLPNPHADEGSGGYKRRKRRGQSQIRQLPHPIRSNPHLAASSSREIPEPPLRPRYPNAKPLRPFREYRLFN